MDVSCFYNEKLEKIILEIIKFYKKFYDNNIVDYQRKIISIYKGWSSISYFLLGLDKSLELHRPKRKMRQSKNLFIYSITMF